MGIRIDKKIIVYESVCGVSVVPDTVFPSREGVVAYTKDNPFPGTVAYTLDDLLIDVLSDAAWWLPDEITEEQKTYIVEMTGYFWK